MKLVITSPLAAHEYQVAWVELHTSKGSFVIQHGHAPMVLPLSPDKDIIFQLKSGKMESLVIAQGIADIDRDSINLIVNTPA